VKENTVAVVRTVTAVDEHYAKPLLTASESSDRELISLAYITGTNTTAVIPMFWILPPTPATESDGSYNTISGGPPLFCIGTGSNAAISTFTPCWPWSGKSNLAARVVIPAGWMLLASPLDADMDGTIIYHAVTRAV